jgi:hypothetical protein
LEDNIPEFETSGPLASSVDCSETNVSVMPPIIGECGSAMEAVSSLVYITIVIETI